MTEDDYIGELRERSPRYAKMQATPETIGLADEANRAFPRSPKLWPSLLLLVLLGCASAHSPAVDAASRVQPVILALRKFHAQTGNYPERLQELQPRYLKTDVPLEDNSDLKHVWRVQDSRLAPNDYWLALYSAPCSQAIFNKRGKLVAAYGPNWSNDSRDSTPR